MKGKGLIDLSHLFFFLFFTWWNNLCFSDLFIYFYIVDVVITFIAEYGMPIKVYGYNSLSDKNRLNGFSLPKQCFFSIWCSFICPFRQHPIKTQWRQACKRDNGSEQTLHLGKGSYNRSWEGSMDNHFLHLIYLLLFDVFSSFLFLVYFYATKWNTE